MNKYPILMLRYSKMNQISLFKTQLSLRKMFTVNASGAIHLNGIFPLFVHNQYSFSYCGKAIAQSVNLIV